MRTETVFMPDTDGSGEISELFVQVGDQVANGDSLLVLESDKASIEVPSPYSGTVKSWIIAVGEEASSGSPLVILECVESSLPEAESTTSEITDPQAVDTKLKDTLDAEQKPDLLAVENTPTMSATNTLPLNNTPINSGPMVRKMARELGVDLALVNSTNRHNRILKQDLQSYVKRHLTKTTTASHTAETQGTGISPIPLEDFSRYGHIEKKPLSNIGKATSAHMNRCWLNIPHVTLFDEVNIDDAEAFRKSIDPETLGLSRSLTLLPIVISIVARALEQFPQFNVSFDANNNEIIQKFYINIGFAVDSPAGLVVPVIQEANKKSIRELALDVIELSTKARARKLKPAEMSGGCFTISSLGAIGGSGFTPIINGPEVGILGIAKSSIKPMWDGTQFIPANQLPLCLSFDHRVINGGDAGRFMAYIHATLADIRRLAL